MLFLLPFATPAITTLVTILTAAKVAEKVVEKVIRDPKKSPKIPETTYDCYRMAKKLKLKHDIEEARKNGDDDKADRLELELAMMELEDRGYI